MQQKKTRSLQKLMNRLFQIELENGKKWKERRKRGTRHHKITIRFKNFNKKVCGFQKLSKTFPHWIGFIFLEEEWFKAIYSFKHFLARIQILFQMKNALAWQCFWPLFYFYATFGKFWKLARLLLHLNFKRWVMGADQNFKA